MARPSSAAPSPTHLDSQSVWASGGAAPHHAVATGTLKVQGGGRDVAGEFTASECTALNWSIPCE